MMRKVCICLAWLPRCKVLWRLLYDPSPWAVPSFIIKICNSPIRGWNSQSFLRLYCDMVTTSISALAYSERKLWWRGAPANYLNTTDSQSKQGCSQARDFPYTADFLTPGGWVPNQMFLFPPLVLGEAAFSLLYFCHHGAAGPVLKAYWQRAFFLTWLTTRRQRIISEPSPSCMEFPCGLPAFEAHVYWKMLKLGSSDVPCYLIHNPAFRSFHDPKCWQSPHFLGLLWSLLSLCQTFIFWSQAWRELYSLECHFNPSTNPISYAYGIYGQADLSPSLSLPWGVQTTSSLPWYIEIAAWIYMCLRCLHILKVHPSIKHSGQ